MRSLRDFLLQPRLDKIGMVFLKNALKIRQKSINDFSVERDNYFFEFIDLAKYNLYKRLGEKDSSNYYLGLYNSIRANFIAQLGKLNDLEQSFYKAKGCRRKKCVNRLLLIASLRPLIQIQGVVKPT